MKRMDRALVVVTGHRMGKMTEGARKQKVDHLSVSMPESILHFLLPGL